MVSKTTIFVKMQELIFAQNIILNVNNIKIKRGGINFYGTSSID